MNRLTTVKHSVAGGKEQNTSFAYYDTANRIARVIGWFDEVISEIPNFTSFTLRYIA